MTCLILVFNEANERLGRDVLADVRPMAVCAQPFRRGDMAQSNKVFWTNLTICALLLHWEAFAP